VAVSAVWAAPALAPAFRARCAAKAAAAEKAEAMAVAGRDGWLFLASELRHLGVGKFWGPEAAKVSRATRPDRADPLPAILDFKAQLDRAGIELLLVPVPPKAVIYPDKLFPDMASGTSPPSRLDAYHQQFYATLRQNKVNVLDLTPELLARRSDADGGVFCKTDTHWSGRGCVVAARRIAAAVGKRPWRSRPPGQSPPLAQEQRKVQITGDLAGALSPSAPAGETLSLRFVGVRKNGALQPLEPDQGSPVVLLGDSHNLVFHAGGDMLARGAGLPDQLALELGRAVDLVAVRGSGATPARVSLLRRARANPNYLARKKLVIWCFGAREFTESSGWQRVPVGADAHPGK
jgi:alginate O-acetyltransferase complex protein AlgJ